MTTISIFKVLVYAMITELAIIQSSYYGVNGIALVKTQKYDLNEWQIELIKSLIQINFFRTDNPTDDQQFILYIVQNTYTDRDWTLIIKNQTYLLKLGKFFESEAKHANDNHVMNYNQFINGLNYKKYLESKYGPKTWKLLPGPDNNSCAEYMDNAYEGLRLGLQKLINERMRGFNRQYNYNMRDNTNWYDDFIDEIPIVGETNVSLGLRNLKRGFIPVNPDDYLLIYGFETLEKVRNTMYAFIAWMLLFNLAHCELTVKIEDGILRGQILRSRDGRLYYSYTGIPYAKPPIGELRFRSPAAVDPWDGILDAKKESNKCAQNEMVNGQEDCLYLNVYSPKVHEKSLPVMFWIHGGSFTSGHAGPDVHGPEYFMDKNVILVTLNYRLGVIGFLSTEDDVIPGNYGLKDQVMALRWVQKNIIQFNGDPNRVTIFGQSAGGASVGFHMLSKMSKGLFHKAILQSGTPVCLWAVASPGFSRKRAQSLAIIAGCNYVTSEDILKCLRLLPADYLVEIQTKSFAWSNHPCILFNPVVENCDSDQEAFLCHHPIYDFHQESFVPAIVGMNSAEGGLFVSALYNSTSLAETEFQTNFNRLLSIMLFYNQYTKPEEIDEIGERVLKEYFPTGSLDGDTHSNAVNMIGDGLLTHCAVDMANKLSSPVYGYFYDYQNEFSYNYLYGSCKKPLGVTHGDELSSLFTHSSINPNKLNVKDTEVSRLMIDIWYKFVTSETPTIDGTDDGATWPLYMYNTNFPYLHINSAKPKIIYNPLKRGYKFWNQFFNYVQSNSSKFMPRKSPKIKTEL